MRERLGEEAWLIRRFAAARSATLLELVAAVAEAAPFRRMTTPGGRALSVEMTNCGPLGWISDRRGYRYVPADPATGRAWPEMPPLFLQLAGAAAGEAGFAGFAPDACLINRYSTGTRLSLHQDRDEARFDAPIVSVSLGRSATFVFGGRRRSDPVRRVVVDDGDVVVWGGVDRLRFHGVLPLKATGEEPSRPSGSEEAGGWLFPAPRQPAPGAGLHRINLTFRRAA